LKIKRLRQYLFVVGLAVVILVCAGVSRVKAQPALKQMGIDPGEVTILQLGEQSTRLAAMKAGQLEAAILRTNDMEAVGATYDYFANKIVPKKPYPTLKGVKALLELAAKDRPEAARAAPERFVNVSLLKELDDSGFIDGLL